MENMNGNKKKKVYKILSKLENEINDFNKKKESFSNYHETNKQLNNILDTKNSMNMYFTDSIRVKFDYLVSNKYI